MLEDFGFEVPSECPLSSMEFKQREWDKHVTRMDAEGLIKTSRNNILAGRGSPGSPKRTLKEKEEFKHKTEGKIQRNPIFF